MTKTKLKLKRSKTELKPVSIRLPSALKFLDMARTPFGLLVQEEVFTVISPKGRGRGRPLYFFVDELEVFASTRNPDRVREFRAKNGRAKK